MKGVNMKNKIKWLYHFYRTWKQVAKACDMTERNLLNLRWKIDKGEPLKPKAKMLIERAYYTQRPKTTNEPQK